MRGITKRGAGPSHFRAWGFLLFLIVLAGAPAVSAKAADSGDPACESLLAPRVALTDAQRKALERIGQRYKKANLSNVRFTPKSQYPLLIHGFGERHPIPAVPFDHAIVDPEVQDVIVMGGGPAGLVSALYLTDKKLKVSILEREAKLGGLGAGAEDVDGIESGIGSAYSAGPEGQLEHAIYRHIGLSTLKSRLKIPAPIDSFLYNGKLYEGFWETEEVLRELPASFEIFKIALEWSYENKVVSVDDPAGQSIDALTAAQWIRKMPQIVSKMQDKHAVEAFERFLSDPRVDPKDPMRSVIDLIDLYCRSALGMPASDVSALVFADFYISELDTRYTGTLGTGTITKQIIKRLGEKQRRFQATTGATVVKVQNFENHVDVYYLKDGKLHRSRAKYLVYSAPVKSAPKIIDGFAQLAPERVPMIDKLDMTHYLVHVLRLKGHPFRATFDLWARDEKYTHDGAMPDPTDFILGRWVDPKIRGYRGMRDFRKNPEDDRGILTVYHPLGTYAVGKGLTREQVTALAEHAVNRTKEMLNPILKAKWGTELDIELVETYRWPNSIHVVRPGYLMDAETLARPIGRIHFANNSVRTPEIEDAMKQGRFAADEILDRMKKDRTRVRRP